MSARKRLSLHPRLDELGHDAVLEELVAGLLHHQVAPAEAHARGEGPAVQQHLALLLALEPAEAARERGLARAVPAHDSQDVPAPHLEAHVCQDLCAALEAQGQPPGLEPSILARGR